MQRQEKVQKVSRPIARAIVQCLRALPCIETIAAPYWYCAMSVATQLRGYGITSQIDEEFHVMVLSETIRIPLYRQRPAGSNTLAIGPERLQDRYATFIVRGEDLAYVVYRYCFKEPLDVFVARPDVVSGRFGVFLYKPMVQALTAFFAFWRLLTLLTPSPRLIYLGLNRPCVRGSK